jgi:hypothetical protein
MSTAVALDLVPVFPCPLWTSRQSSGGEVAARPIAVARILARGDADHRIFFLLLCLFKALLSLHDEFVVITQLGVDRR